MRNASLSGRKAVVTGADRAIGAAVLTRLQAAGAQVLAVQSHAFQDCDRDYVDLAAELAQIATFAPDILVNADDLTLVCRLEDMDQRDFERVYDVNVLRPLQFCQASVPAMKSSGWGRIVNVGSSLAQGIVPGHMATAATRSALDILTACIACEHASSGILANTVAAGFLDAQQALGSESEAVAELLPMKRACGPDEVAALVIWLAGPENTYVTGQSIAADGGFARFC